MKAITRVVLTMATILLTAGCSLAVDTDQLTDNQNNLQAPNCGPSTCAKAEVCCNASCGICAAPGEGCTRELCLQPIDAGSAPVTCGKNTCASGEYCCNESCGVCAAPGTGCTRELCR